MQTMVEWLVQFLSDLLVDLLYSRLKSFHLLTRALPDLLRSLLRSLFWPRIRSMGHVLPATPNPSSSQRPSQRPSQSPRQTASRTSGHAASRTPQQQQQFSGRQQGFAPRLCATLGSTLGSTLRSLIALACALTVLTASRAQAEVLFEGYSKVLLGGTHVGFVVQRIEFDAKKKEFLNIYYLKTNQVGGNITESLKARATANLAPLSYQFTELNGDKARTIDATVKGSTLTAVIREAGANPNQAGQAGRANNAGQTVTKKLPKGAFFASFLGYVMLQGKEGIKTGAKYGYQAIAEEDANLYAGEAFISGEESVNGITAFKVLNTFKGARFVSHVTHKGEVIATRSPVQQVATELVGSMAEATAGVALNTSSLEALFGSVPKGAENTIARRSAGAANATAPTGAGAAPVPAQAPALEAEPSPSPAPGSSGASSSGTPSSGTPSPGKSSAGKSSSGQPSAARSKKSVLQATPPSSGESPKKQGVPGGQGIIIKNSLTNQGSSDSQPEPSAQPAQSAPNSQPAQDTERGGSAK